MITVELNATGVWMNNFDFFLFFPPNKKIINFMWISEEFLYVVMSHLLLIVKKYSSNISIMYRNYSTK